MKQFEESILKQFDEILFESNEILKTVSSIKTTDGKTNLQVVDRSLSFKWHVRATLLIYNICGENHYLLKKMEKAAMHSIQSLQNFSDCINIFTIARDEFAKDGINRIRVFLRHENLNDILMQAEAMADDKDNHIVAPVLAGCALEYFIHEVCKKNSIELEKHKANYLNERLCEKEVYTAIVKGQILSFLQIRNAAAHGKFPSAIESKKMVSDVTHFITNNINLL